MPNLADLIDDHRKFVPALPLQDVIEQGRFPRAEETGEDADRNDFSG